MAIKIKLRVKVERRVCEKGGKIRSISKPFIAIEEKSQAVVARSKCTIAEQRHNSNSARWTHLRKRLKTIWKIHDHAILVVSSLSIFLFYLSICLELHSISQLCSHRIAYRLRFRSLSFASTQHKWCVIIFPCNTFSRFMLVSMILLTLFPSLRCVCAREKCSGATTRVMRRRLNWESLFWWNTEPRRRRTRRDHRSHKCNWMLISKLLSLILGCLFP